jgi:hypothetical protein
MEKTKTEIFLEFNYKELKDLGKHFLTISSASVVFVLTFFEKIVSTGHTDQNIDSRVKIGGILLLISVITSGIGLFTNYIAGSGAANSMMWKIGRNYRLFTKFTYVLYITAGVSLIIAYITLMFFAGNK